MAQWINVFRNNGFVNLTQLPLLCKKTGAIAIVEPGLTAGWEAIYGAPFVSKLLYEMCGSKKQKSTRFLCLGTKIDLIFMSRHKNRPDFYQKTKIDSIFNPQKSTRFLTLKYKNRLDF